MIARRRWIPLAVVLACGAAVAAIPRLRWEAGAMIGRMRRLTVEDRLAEFGPAVEARLAPDFAAAGIALPPRRLLLVAFKDSRRLELYAADRDDAAPARVRGYAILAASGGPGPKLREGDRQVPEGAYRVESLNPNSRFHVALRLDYPNAEDRACAARDGRAALGGDIMIHGKDGSIGCLAMGDPAAEELFWLAAKVGPERVEVLIAPTDFRRGDVADPVEPPWLAGRYARLRAALRALPP